MSHRTVSGYWDAYNRLPTDVRNLADRAFTILKADPNRPSLRLKKVDPDAGFVWFWIGTHAEDDRLIR